MTIIWTKGRTVKQIARAMHTARPLEYRICIRHAEGVLIVDGVTQQETVRWMETHAHELHDGWQIDLGNSVLAFGFNGTSYFG
jgi:hypothetical protein